MRLSVSFIWTPHHIFSSAILYCERQRAFRTGARDTAHVNSPLKVAQQEITEQYIIYGPQDRAHEMQAQISKSLVHSIKNRQPKQTPGDDSPTATNRNIITKHSQ
jgi:hypothetical protein